MDKPLLVFTNRGIHCPRADVYIDPTRAVSRAIITHAHSDHARRGHRRYLAHRDSAVFLRYRLGADLPLRTVDYGETVEINGVRFSLHPAGHIRGSAQVRVEYRGEVWVVSGDYKTEDDGVSAPFEVVPCTTFVTESTFALPVYRWRPQEHVFADIAAWWRANADDGRATVVLGYSLGKAQRIARHIDGSIGPVFAHGSVYEMHKLHIEDGVDLPPVRYTTRDTPQDVFRGALIIAPPSVLGTPWMQRFEPYTAAFCSGWVAARRALRGRGFDRGFVLSDHADWDELNTVVRETGAERVYVMHGFTSVFARWLNEQGIEAHGVDNKRERTGVERTEEQS